MIYLNIILDLAMIGLLIVGINYAVKLAQRLAEMRSSHAQMERFVADFNATVGRAEAGIRGLKNTARTCGDDLEKLIDKGHLLRDELNFLTESADLIANRLSSSASQASRAQESALPAQKETNVKDLAPKVTAAKPQAIVQEIRNTLTSSGKTPSTAERELLRALEKLG